MTDSYEQSAVVQFCFPLQENAVETAISLQSAYKEYEWISWFTNVEMAIESVLQPIEQTKMNFFMHQHRRRTIGKLEGLYGLFVIFLNENW